jgi:hypothetical protein
MKKKIISYFSNGSLIIGVVSGVYALVKIYLIKSKLPAGVCPFIDNRPLLYSAIVFCCISYILSFFE